MTTASADWTGLFRDGSPPLEIEGVRVRMGGADAALSYAGPAQVNALVPAGLTAGGCSKHSRLCNAPRG